MRDGTPIPVLTLDMLVTDPELIQTLSGPDCRLLAIRLASLQTLILSRLLAADPPAIPPTEPVRYLTVEEVVQQFHVGKEWLYRNKKRLPHSQPSRKTLLFPEEKLRRWFATRTDR